MGPTRLLSRYYWCPSFTSVGLGRLSKGTCPSSPPSRISSTGRDPSSQLRTDCPSLLLLLARPVLSPAPTTLVLSRRGDVSSSTPGKRVHGWGLTGWEKWFPTTDGSRTNHQGTHREFQCRCTKNLKLKCHDKLSVELTPDQGIDLPADFT